MKIRFFILVLSLSLITSCRFTHDQNCLTAEQEIEEAKQVGWSSFRLGYTTAAAGWEKERAVLYLSTVLGKHPDMITEWMNKE